MKKALAFIAVFSTVSIVGVLADYVAGAEGGISAAAIFGGFIIGGLISCFTDN